MISFSICSGVSVEMYDSSLFSFMVVILSGKNNCSICDNYMKNELSEQWYFLLFYEMILHPQQSEIQDANLTESGANLQKIYKK